MDNVFDDKNIVYIDPILIWQHYLNLEDDFLQFLRYVPLKKEHYNVWSPFLANLLNNTGSVIDSLLKNSFIVCAHTVDSERKNEFSTGPFNMGTYRKYFENRYHLSEKSIFDMINHMPINPFSGWEREESPDWWIDYREIKHDRFRNIGKATMKITLDALGALFLLNVTINDTKMVLIRDGFVKSYNPKIDTPGLYSLLIKDEPLEVTEPIYVTTKLFGYVYQDLRPYSDQMKIQILGPKYG